MSQSPSVIAAKDQMLAAVRDRFDETHVSNWTEFSW